MDVYKASCAHYVALHQGGEHIHGVKIYTMYARMQVSANKKTSVKAKRRLLKQGAKHNLGWLCNSLSAITAQFTLNRIIFLFTLADLQRLTFPVFARPSQGLV